MIDLLLPRTDTGAAVHAVAGAIVYAVLLVVVRRRRELRTFVLGLATITTAWFALRTVH